MADEGAHVIDGQIGDGVGIGAGQVGGDGAVAGIHGGVPRRGGEAHGLQLGQKLLVYLHAVQASEQAVDGRALGRELGERGQVGRLFGGGGCCGGSGYGVGFGHGNLLCSRRGVCDRPLVTGREAVEGAALLGVRGGLAGLGALVGLGLGRGLGRYEVSHDALSRAADFGNAPALVAPFHGIAFLQLVDEVGRVQTGALQQLVVVHGLVDGRASRRRSPGR